MGRSVPHNMVPWAHPNPQPKQHLDRFSRFFCTDDRRVSLYFAVGHPFLPQNWSFPSGMWTPYHTWLLGSTRVLNPNGIWIDSAVFAWLTTVTGRQTDDMVRCYGSM